MEYLYYSGGIIGSIVLGYYGYKYAKYRFYQYVFEKVNEELDRRMQKENDFVPMRKTTSAILNVSHGGKSHSVYVPYNRNTGRKMMKHNVFLWKNGEKIDITQKPGIPYLVSAADLGGEKIIVENKEGEEINIYTGKKIPDCF